MNMAYGYATEYLHEQCATQTLQTQTLQTLICIPYLYTVSNHEI